MGDNQKHDSPETNSVRSMPADNEWNVDLLEIILNDIGGTFKKYQIINYILFCLPLSLSGAFALNYVFTALNVEYRCLIPECESNNTSQYDPLWLQNAIPFEKGKPSKCERYENYANPTIHLLGDDTCPKSNFNHSNTVGCNELLFKTDELSIVNHYHFECDGADWKLAMVGTASNLGRFIFMPIMGILSDRFGRRTILIAGVFGSSVFAYIESIAPNFVTYVLFEFLGAGIGSMTYSASFILAMEWIGIRDRVLILSVITATYPFGQIFLGFTARAVRDFRRLLQIIHAPGFLILFYFWIAPESIRWLIVNQQKERVLATIERAEKINGLKLSQNTIDRINITLSEKIHMNTNNTDHSNRNNDSTVQQFKIIFTKIKLLMRFLICAFAWLTCAFVSYGISLTSVSFSGDKYVSFVVIAIAGIPAMLFHYFLMESMGRRWTISMSLMICGISIIVSKSLPPNLSILSITLFFIGKCFNAVAFAGIYVYTSELWPTSIRHSIMGLCSTIGRIGASAAPQAPLFQKYLEILPYLLFGAMSVIASMLILKLPETLKRKLPDTLSEAEQIEQESVNETS